MPPRSTVPWRRLRVLKTPVRTPQANAFCERLIGTIRRECLDWLIPLNERHLRRILRERVTHYNRGRPHASLGPGFPEASAAQNSLVAPGHHFPARCRVVATPILSGLPRVSLGARGRVMAASILRSTARKGNMPRRGISGRRKSSNFRRELAPRAGLEPATLRLTEDGSGSDGERRRATKYLRRQDFRRVRRAP